MREKKRLMREDRKRCVSSTKQVRLRRRKRMTVNMKEYESRTVRKFCVSVRKKNTNANVNIKECWSRSVSK